MTVEMNGRQLTLSYTVSAVCDMERALGVSLYELLKTNVTCVRALFWCGLLSSPAQCTLKEAGEMLDEFIKAGGSLTALGALIAQALEDAGFFH